MDISGLTQKCVSNNPKNASKSGVSGKTLANGKTLSLYKISIILQVKLAYNNCKGVQLLWNLILNQDIMFMRGI